MPFFGGVMRNSLFGSRCQPRSAEASGQEVHVQRGWRAEASAGSVASSASAVGHSLAAGAARQGTRRHGHNSLRLTSTGSIEDGTAGGGRSAIVTATARLGLATGEGIVTGQRGITAPLSAPSRW